MCPLSMRKREYMSTHFLVLLYLHCQISFRKVASVPCAFLGFIFVLTLNGWLKYFAVEDEDKVVPHQPVFAGGGKVGE